LGIAEMKKTIGRRVGQRFDYLFAIAGFEIILQITEGGPDFAAVFLIPSFSLQIVVTDEVAGEFLDFAFGFIDTTLGLILVHGVLLGVRLIEGWAVPKMQSATGLERLGRTCLRIGALTPIAE
jgi:hypothetical protein